MGKGCRNRARRAEGADEPDSEAATRQAVAELFAIETFDEYVAVLKRRPELDSDEAASQLREAAQWPGYGPLYARTALLLDGARSGDAAVAWAAYREATDATAQVADEIASIEAELYSARETGDHARVLELVDVALPGASDAGLGATVCRLLNERGVALYRLGTINRADELDAAIDAFQAGLEVAVSDEEAAGLLMHLGLAFGERIHGDRADNIDDAVRVLREAIRLLDGSEDDELRAMVRTNLSVALARGEGNDRRTVLREAAELCREALRYRSVQRNADDWAYSQINLGEALRDLAALGEGDAADARGVFEEVVDHAGDIGDMSHAGVAHQLLGRMDMALAHRSAEDYIEAYAAGALRDQPDAEPALRAARGHLESARDLITNDPIRRARVLDQLSEVLADLGEGDAAIAAARDALTVLRPTTAPDSCKEAAWRLGALLMDRDDWEGAADALREAVEAAELIFHARLDTVSREREARKTGNLHRWGTYAIARAGDAVGAAVVLDAGRGREISRRLGGDSALTAVPDELREDYRSAVERLATSALASDSTGASRHLQQVIAAIRALPGHDRFGTGPQWEELTRGVETDWPVMYVNPAPSGTLLLTLWPDDIAGAQPEATFIEATSNDIIMRLIAGDGAEPETSAGGGASYLYAIGTADDGLPRVAEALDQLLPWLGETVGRPIASVLSARGATGVTLIVCGPLGLAPLHAASWLYDGGPSCLADAFDIRFAPSAVAAAAALRREPREGSARLVAVADPHGDLLAAQPEVDEIAALFDRANVEIAVGDRADIAFLRTHAPRATYLHLACHAHGGLFDATDAAVTLASGDLPAHELTTVAQLDARLVVISACQSALSEIAGLPDEVVSIATALLVSGSAGVIASLWPVDDLATALLMTRLYHEMLRSGRRPPEALRCAQLWLRDLDEHEEQRFLQRHPALAAEFERRTHSDRGAPGRRSASAKPPIDRRDADAGGDRPYAHPDYWAPFVALGV